MYRDDPLDDEMELRAIVGDALVDCLVGGAPTALDDAVGTRTPLDVALDVLRVLQGWADDAEITGWFTQGQRRLDGRSPIAALVDGAYDDVDDAARAWVAARG